jgi:hypothetical protein
MGLPSHMYSEPGACKTSCIYDNRKSEEAAASTIRGAAEEAAASLSAAGQLGTLLHPTASTYWTSTPSTPTTTVTCRRRASPSRRWPAWKPHTRVTDTSCRTAPKYLRCSPEKETPPSRHSTRTRWASRSARGHPATGTTVWLSLPPLFVFLGVLAAYYLGDPPPLGSKSPWSSWTIMKSYVRLLYNKRFTYQSNLIEKCGYLF